MISQGRSFSGNERNCAFLNVEGERFADVSAATGLNLNDDARALVASDWDFDGQIDFWVSNRGAPRVRFLHNVSSESENGAFVGIGLRGTTCNRDAIGARTEVYLEGQTIPIIRSLRAGEGFLAQKSKWLHFGLGDASSIERVTVRWPGGQAEDFSGVQVNGHYRLTQGAGVAKSWRLSRHLMPTAEAAPPRGKERQDNELRRTWLMGRVPVPELGLTIRKQPTLLNLWSRTCSACTTELGEWTAQEAALRQNELDIVALAVDHLASEEPALNEQVLDKLRFPFRRGQASRELVNALEMVHLSLVERQQPLPVPSSFLIDAQGRVAAIYKGTVPTTTLLRDVKLLTADLETQRTAAVPYSGRWASEPFPPNPTRVAATFEKAGQALQAIDYLRRFLAGARTYLQDQYGDQKQQLQIVVDAHILLGDLLAQEGRFPEAARVYTNLIKLAPFEVSLHQRVGEVLLTQNLPKEALPHLLIAARILPSNANVQFNTGLASLGAGQAPQAITFFRQALVLEPGDLATKYQLAVAYAASGKGREALQVVDDALAKTQTIDSNKPIYAALQRLRAQLTATQR